MVKASAPKACLCDYDMDHKDFQSHVDCEFDIVEARLNIAQLESCYQQPQLKGGIQDYERKIGLH
jgi:hypothetical protein